MSVEFVEVSRNGRSVNVPSVEIDGTIVVANGAFPRIAAVRDEDFVESIASRDPSRFIREIAASSLRADVVTFAQNICDATPNHPYFYEWDNVAAADTTSFTDWWEKLPQATRKNCRRATRRGVVTRAVDLDEQLARGIKSIYDETPMRQGRRFWHYGKDVETVWRENSSYLERSQFLATYFNDDLIGFIKFVYVGRVARIMQILSRVAHYEKRPMNALIAKAVEVCHAKGVTHLVYSKFQYGNKTNSQITEFKSRNGFVRLEFPRYYIPLTVRGRLALSCRLHRGMLGILPPQLIGQALRWREAVNGLVMSNRNKSGDDDRSERPGAEN